MKNRCIVAAILVHFTFLVHAQMAVTTSYSASGIADSLKKDANAVYRLDEAVLEIASPSKYTMKVHEIITVLNSDGAYHLAQSTWFDKFNTVDDIEVKIYNSVGIEMHSYRKKDFNVRNYYDGMSLATDDKIMRLPVAAPGYPCTVETRYTKSATGYTDLPDWILNNASSSVEQFRFVVKVPGELDIRYRSLNMQLEPTIENMPKAKVYTWDTKNVAVKKIEADGYEGSRYLPEVEVSPNVFEYDGYKGDFRTWKDFGKWCYGLYDEKNPFTPQRIAEIKSMIKDMPDEEGKIKVLYDYMQKNMRYVSIQFGIGGFKPFAASFVDQKKYGDCKALTNYMRSLLAVAGIKSYPALINAGYNKAPASPGFPENIFNHVILCVPHTKDSTWLECTSASSDAGFLGSFTENKNALLLTEDGGIIISTPRSNYNSNVLSTFNDIFVHEDGSAEVSSRLSSTGSFYELLDQVAQMETGRLNELFVNYLDYKEPDELKLENDNGANDSHELKAKFIYAKLFDFKAGDKFFFPKSISRLCSENVALHEKRKIEYIFNYPYKKVDTTIFHLPADFAVDNLPAPKDLDNQFVTYRRSAVYDAASNTIRVVSNLFLKQNIIMPDQYQQVSGFFDTIHKEEANKLVLKKAG